MKKFKIEDYLLIGLVVCLPAISSGQNTDDSPKNKSYMHHETPGDKYLPNSNKNHATSPAYTYKSTTFFTTQVNVDENGNNIIGDAANEPSIAVDPTNPNRIVIGWRQFDDVNNNFRQAGYGYSDDGGQTWTFPGVINPGIFRSDPVLDCDSEGIFYYNSLTVDDFNNYTCNVYRSGEGGFDWDGGTFAQGGDKQWMIIDKTASAGAGNIYSFWTSSYSICYPENFTRSTDGGNFYEDCVSVDGDPYWGTMAIGPNGELYIGGAGGWDGIVVAKSTSAQNSGEIVNWDYYTSVDIGGYVTGWTNINPEGILGQVSIDVDRSGGPGNGNVYALASVERNSNPDPADVMFVRSTDGGLSWSSAIRINDDIGTSNYQWFGTMSVAPTGRIDVIWLDTRDATSNPYMSALYYSYSIDQGFTWSANEKLSDSFDPHVGWPNQQKMGDYFEMESDETGAHLAWANTLNGEEDVYYGHIMLQFTGTGSIAGDQHFQSLTSYPNPFAGKTTIRYSLQATDNVKLVIYDVMGKEIKTLVNKTQPAGSYTVDFVANEIAGSICYCRLIAGEHSETIRLAMIK